MAVLTLAPAGAAPQHPGGNRWAQYEREMQDPIDDPPDAWEPTEFAFARLRYRSPRDGYFRRFARWGTDANKGDRLFMQAIRRLTRVHVRSVEEIVDVDSDEIFNWPFCMPSAWAIGCSAIPRRRACANTSTAAAS